MTLATSHWLWAGHRIFQCMNLCFAQEGEACYFSLTLSGTYNISVYVPVFYSRGWGLLHLTDSDLDMEFFSLLTCLFLKRVTLATCQWLWAGLVFCSRGWGLLHLFDSHLDLEFFSLYTCLFLKRVTLATSHWLWAGLRIFQCMNHFFGQDGEACYI